MSGKLRIVYLGMNDESESMLAAAVHGLAAELRVHRLFSEALEELSLGACRLLVLQDGLAQELLAQLRGRWPGLRIMAICPADDGRAVLQNIRAGIDDVLILDEQFPDQLRRAILAQDEPDGPPGAPAAAADFDNDTDNEAARLTWEHGGCTALLDDNGRFISASPALTSLLGRGSSSLSGRQLGEFIDIRQAEPKPLEESAGSGSSFMADIELSAGHRGRMLFTLTAITQGNRSLRLLQARDVTAQQRSEILASSQTRLVEMIMAGVELSDVLAALAKDVCHIHSGALCTVMVADNEQGLLHNAFLPRLPEDQLRMLDSLSIGPDGSCCGRAAGLGRRVCSTMLLDDEERMLQLTGLGFSHEYCVAQPVISASGTVLGTLALYLPAGQLPADTEFQTLEIAANLAGVAMDRLNNERAKAKMEARFRNQFEQSPLAMQVYSTDGRALRGNQVWMRMFAQRRQQFEHYNILSDPAIASQGLLSYVKRGFQGESVELPVLRQPEDGQADTPLPFLPWTRCFIYSIDDSEGRPGEVILVHEDMSDRRITEDSLRHSEERLRSLVEGTSDLIFTVSRHGTLTAINAAFEKETTHRIPDWIGRNPRDLVHADDQRSVQQLFLAVMRGQGSSDLEVRFSCGADSYRSATLSAIPIEEDGLVRGAFFTLHDDSEHRLVEEERLRLLTAIERVDEMIIITDRAGRIDYVNPAFERISGYRFKEIRQFTARILRSEEHDDAFFAEMWQSLSSGEVWRGEIVNNTASGGQFRVDAAITPIVGSTGEIINYVGVMRDITAKSMLEMRLQHTQKMEAIGSLAGGIAHDFNNILSAIIGYTQIVKRELTGDERMQGNLDSVLQASRRASELVRQILTFSQHRESRREAVSTQRIAREVLKLIRASLPSTIEIRQSLLDVEGTVVADASQLHQLVMNLCTNAGQAMEEEGGILEVELSRREITDPLEARGFGIEEGSYQVLRVRDTGQGMDEQTQKRIFEPFFTTKATGRGTGLGLSVVHGIVTQLGGTIRVVSQPGLGSEFLLLLPRSENVEQLAPEPDFSNINGCERVLLVDDEEMVAAMADQALTQMGYSVTRTLNPEEALRLLECDPDGFDVLVTDQTMPGMTGVQLTAEMHRIRPDLPVILCTGFSRTVSHEAARKYGLSAFLDKPASPEKIAATIRMVLDRKQTPIPVAISGSILAD